MVYHRLVTLTSLSLSFLILPFSSVKCRKETKISKGLLIGNKNMKKNKEEEDHDYDYDYELCFVLVPIRQ